MTNKFKVGDKVLLREDSKYNNGSLSNPLGVRGVITLDNHSRYFIEVEWDNGSYNVYREEDLKHYEEEFMGFKPSDLKDGMVVTLRDGRQGIVFGGRIERTFDDIVEYKRLNSLNRVDDYDDQLIAKYAPDYDIMEVSYMGEVLWEREEDTKQKELEELYRQIDELKEKADKIKGG